MLNLLIKEAEYKQNILPASYIPEYFEKDFIPKLKIISAKLLDICNEQSDSLPETLLRDRIKRIIF